jgi:plastocyanin
MPSRSFAPLAALFAVAVQLLVVAVVPVRADDSAPGSPDVTITLRNGLSDRDISVSRGAVVRFDNRDDERHRMRSRSGDGFDTGNLEPGESFQARMSTAGTFTYIDEREDDDARYFGRIRVTGGASGGSSGSSGGANGGNAGTTGAGNGGDAGTTGAGNGTNGGATPGGSPKATATVTIVDEAFDPGTTTIAVGGTVTFENLDGDEHTATSAGTGGIDSDVLGTGATYKKTFADAGSFPFLCIFHPEMRGTIEVVGEAGRPDANVAPDPVPPTPVAPAPAPASSSTAVDIVDLAFEPADVQVTTGTTVTWTNIGVARHTATAKDGSFDSRMLETGGTFAHTFTAPGTIAYLCQVHPDMSGTIEVVAAAPSAAGAGAAASAVTATGNGTPAATTEGAPSSADGAAAAASPADPARADLGSLGGIALAVTMVSVATALFARLLRGTANRA